MKNTYIFLLFFTGVMFSNIVETVDLIEGESPTVAMANAIQVTREIQLLAHLIMMLDNEVHFAQGKAKMRVGNMINETLVRRVRNTRFLGTGGDLDSVKFHLGKAVGKVVDAFKNISWSLDDEDDYYDDDDDDDDGDNDDDDDADNLSVNSIEDALSKVDPDEELTYSSTDMADLEMVLNNEDALKEFLEMKEEASGHHIPPLNEADVLKGSAAVKQEEDVILANEDAILDALLSNNKDTLADVLNDVGSQIKELSPEGEARVRGSQQVASSLGNNTLELRSGKFFDENPPIMSETEELSKAVEIVEALHLLEPVEKLVHDHLNSIKEQPESHYEHPHTTVLDDLSAYEHTDPHHEHPHTDHDIHNQHSSPESHYEQPHATILDDLSAYEHTAHQPMPNEFQDEEPDPFDPSSIAQDYYHEHQTPDPHHEHPHTDHDIHNQHSSPDSHYEHPHTTVLDDFSEYEHTAHQPTTNEFQDEEPDPFDPASIAQNYYHEHQTPEEDPYQHPHHSFIEEDPYIHNPQNNGNEDLEGMIMDEKAEYLEDLIAAENLIAAASSHQSDLEVALQTGDTDALVGALLEEVHNADVPLPISSENSIDLLPHSYGVDINGIGCDCQESSCGCCFNLNLKPLAFSSSGCLLITYRDINDVDLLMKYNGAEVFFKRFSLFELMPPWGATMSHNTENFDQNSPEILNPWKAINTRNKFLEKPRTKNIHHSKQILPNRKFCFSASLPFSLLSPLDICGLLHDMTINNNYSILDFCVKLKIKSTSYPVVNREIGCMKIPISGIRRQIAAMTEK
ncbi:unnamed protein product [Psylliodes chrysocephalus]|uniref:DUF4773 domain-containing protein n=1 Tax=Psylliodes chrysocephalus TaxID=3402493 RepID=A0A9P0GDZ6_9CUCU|nr:unnamed protein product [Psylliodes chrysocephala]